MVKHLKNFKNLCKMSSHGWNWLHLINLLKRLGKLVSSFVFFSAIGFALTAAADEGKANLNRLHEVGRLGGLVGLGSYCSAYGVDFADMAEEVRLQSIQISDEQSQRGDFEGRRRSLLFRVAYRAAQTGQVYYKGDFFPVVVVAEPIVICDLALRRTLEAKFHLRSMLD